MFLGTYEPKLDDKGRLILPARYREKLASGVVLTRGQERCLYAFPLSEFERMYGELTKAPISSKQARDYIRVMLSGAQDQIPDKQGRITIAQPLRQYAKLERDLAVVGVGARVEIWDSTAWSEYLSRSEDDFAQTAQEVIPGLF